MEHTSIFSPGLALVTLALTFNVFAEPRYSGLWGEHGKNGLLKAGCRTFPLRVTTLGRILFLAHR